MAKQRISSIFLYEKKSGYNKKNGKYLILDIREEWQKIRKWQKTCERMNMKRERL